MITEQERIIKRSQGYDIGFEQNGKKYWINSDAWDGEKEERLFQETGLRTLREETGNKNLVLYDSNFFEAISGVLHYKSCVEKDIPQPINMSSAFQMFFRLSGIQSLDLSDWDMSNVVAINRMFQDCNDLLSINLSSWDTQSIITTSRMFLGCSSVESINLDNWNVQSLKYMDYMFFECM